MRTIRTRRPAALIGVALVVLIAIIAFVATRSTIDPAADRTAAQAIVLHGHDLPHRWAFVHPSLGGSAGDRAAAAVQPKVLKAVLSSHPECRFIESIFGLDSTTGPLSPAQSDATATTSATEGSAQTVRYADLQAAVTYFRTRLSDQPTLMSVRHRLASAAGLTCFGRTFAAAVATGLPHGARAHLDARATTLALPAAATDLATVRMSGSVSYGLASFPLHFFVSVVVVDRCAVDLYAADLGERAQSKFYESLVRTMVARAATAAR